MILSKVWWCDIREIHDVNPVWWIMWVDLIKERKFFYHNVILNLF